jgi:hypothetical protein
MAQAAVVAAVTARLASFARCPIAGINMQGDTPADASPFLAVEYPVANEQQITVGAPGNNVFRETGAIRFVLSIRRGRGVDQGMGWADELRTLFRGQQFANVNTWAPSSPVLDNANDSGSYWRLTFAVPYYFDFVG